MNMKELKFYTPLEILVASIESNTRLSNVCQQINDNLGHFSLNNYQFVIDGVIVKDTLLTTSEIHLLTSVYRHYGWKVKFLKRDKPKYIEENDNFYSVTIESLLI